ncbi:MAG TPA: hypothetical protein HPP97_13430 [Desulfuromonadales bacterium]|nr:hypothetical protein [Desulfuromonadales bacterium]
MKERHLTRYDTQRLPKSLSKVTIFWGDDSSAEANVANFCTHGMRVLIPKSIEPSDLPRKNDSIKVKLSIVKMSLTGMCIYVTDEPDGSVAIGIYYYVPIEQNFLNKLLSKNLNVPLQECSFVCHEWEEFVEKLCNSEDPKLRDIGLQEKEMLEA